MAENKKQLEWNVFYHNRDDKKIDFFNIFDHWRFKNDVEKALKKSRSREALEKEIKSLLFYYFCSKCEWEVLITPWPQREGQTIKVDIYWQVIHNFDRFVDYVAKNKRFRKIAENKADKETTS